MTREPPERPETPLDWMELHLRCLHHHDARGRIVRQRQRGGVRAPRFHLGRTRFGSLWRFRDDLDAECVRALARLAGREPPLPESPAGEPPPPERLGAFRSRLGPAVEWRGPAYRFPEAIPEPPTGGYELREIGPGDEGLLEGALADWASELADRAPCIAAMRDGRALSICASSRPLHVPGSPRSPVAEAGVETDAAARGRGLATAVVAHWALAVRARGGEPMYSTSWENRASRSVARKLSLVFYGEDLHFS